MGREARPKILGRLHWRRSDGQLVAPVRELKGFQKIALGPGEERVVSLSITSTICGFSGPGV